MVDPERDGEYTCRYCGNRMMVAPPPMPPQQRIHIPQIVVNMPTRSIASMFAPFAIMALIGLVGVGFGVIRAITATSTTTNPITGMPESRKDPSERIMVWASGGPLITMQADGRDMFITGRRQVNGGDNLWIVSVDPASGAQRWSTPSLGSYMRGYQAIRYTALGNRLVYSDPDRRVNVLDASSGKLLGSQPISDRAKDICVVGDKVVVDINDGNTLSLNPMTPENGEIKKGSGCPQRWGRSSNGPSIAGFQMNSSSSGNDTGQVTRKTTRYFSGYRSPGTALPQAAATDSTGKKSIWITSLFGGPDADAVERSASFIAASDRGVLTQYLKRVSGNDDEHRLVLLDLNTGAKKWDVALKGIFAVDHLSGVGIGEKYAYIVRMSSVEAHNIDTGALVSVYGDETYDK